LGSDVYGRTKYAWYAQQPAPPTAQLPPRVSERTGGEKKREKSQGRKSKSLPLAKEGTVSKGASNQNVNLQAVGQGPALKKSSAGRKRAREETEVPCTKKQNRTDLRGSCTLGNGENDGGLGHADKEQKEQKATITRSVPKSACATSSINSFSINALNQESDDQENDDNWEYLLSDVQWLQDENIPV
jgi:hypothetical protein